MERKLYFEIMFSLYINRVMYWSNFGSLWEKFTGLNLQSIKLRNSVSYTQWILCTMCGKIRCCLKKEVAQLKDVIELATSEINTTNLNQH